MKKKLLIHYNSKLITAYAMNAKFLFFLIMLLIPELSVAIDLGYYPGLQTAWLISILMSVGLSFIASSKKDEDGGLTIKSKKVFAFIFISSLPFTFTIGLIAFFVS